MCALPKLLAGLVGAFAREKQAGAAGALLEVAQANPKVAITSMNWRDFERLVGEAFRRQGFTVTGFGGSGPDWRGKCAGKAFSGCRQYPKCSGLVQIS